MIDLILSKNIYNLTLHCSFLYNGTSCRKKEREIIGEIIMNSKKIAIGTLSLCFSVLTSACSSPKTASDALSSPKLEHTVAPVSKLPEETDDVVQNKQTIPQSVGIQNAVNVRHFGGYRTQDGNIVRMDKAIRSGTLMNISSADISVLQETYQLREIIDLRDEQEMAEKPAPNIPGVSYTVLFDYTATYEESNEQQTAPETENKTDIVHGIPEFSNPYIQAALTLGDIREVMKQAYRDLTLRQSSIDGYIQFFDILLAQEDGAVLWNCTNGKDRTGVLSALFLSALGVDRETISEDYLLTNMYLEEQAENAVASAMTETDDPKILETIRLMNGVDISYLDEMYQCIETEYGSMDEYLRNAIKLTDDDFIELRRLYTINEQE